MKIIILDVYRKSPYRISKDTNGGYGVENDLGSGLIPELMSRVAKHSIYWPPLAALNLISEFHALNEDVHFSKNVYDIDHTVDYVFLSISIVCSEFELQTLKYLKNKFPKLRIFAFGSFVEFYKKELLKSGASVIIGEPEFLAQQIKLNSSNLNLVHAQGEIKIISNDPDKLAPARWSKYVKANRNFILGNFSSFAPIIATRGCPYSCFEYCTYPLQQGRKVRSVSTEKMIEDIKYINTDSGASNFVFRDPVFSINKKYTHSLLDEMALKLSGFKFTIETHLNNIDEVMAEKLKEASVNWVKFGIESADPNVMEDVSRYNIEKNEQKKGIKLLKKNKIKTDAMYIVCQPLDTVESISNTVDYAIELDTNLAQFSMFTPYPGTPYYEKVKDSKLITKNFEDYTQFKLVFKHKNFTPQAAREILGKAYKKYYMRKLIPFV